MKILFFCAAFIAIYGLRHQGIELNTPTTSPEFTISFLDYDSEYYLNGRIKHLDVTIEDSSVPIGTKWACYAKVSSSGDIIFFIKNRSHFLNGMTCSSGNLSLIASNSEQQKGMNWQYHDLGNNKFKLECLGACKLRWLSASKNSTTLVSKQSDATIFRFSGLENPFEYQISSIKRSQNGTSNHNRSSNEQSGSNGPIRIEWAESCGTGLHYLVVNDDKNQGYKVTIQVPFGNFESLELYVPAGGKTKTDCLKYQPNVAGWQKQ